MSQTFSVARAALPARRFPAAGRRQLVLGLAFISPWIIGFAGFTVYPMLASLYYSLTSYNVITPPTFIGLENYTNLFQDPAFLTSLANTLFLVVFGVPAGLVVAFLLATLLNQRIRGRTLFRLAFFLPAVTPVVAIAVVWLWIYDPQYGLIDGQLAGHGLPAVQWLSNTAVVKPALIIVQAWMQGTNMLIFLAALQGVPRELYEAATIDGARSARRFLHITVPMCTPAILFVLITSLINTFQSFTLPYILTGTGPDNATLLISTYLYQQAFQSFQMGYASTIAWILFLIIVSFSILLMLVSRRWVHYTE